MAERKEAQKEFEVFLSYGHEPEVDKFVTQLKSDLKSAEILVWRDTEDIKAGSDWVNSVAKGVNDCRALLCVLTNKYVSTSETCKCELDFAKKKKKNIFPVLYEDINWDASDNAKGVQLHLTHTQHVDFRNGKANYKGKAYKEALTKLLEGMEDKGLGRRCKEMQGGGQGVLQVGDQDETQGRRLGQDEMQGAVQGGVQGVGQGEGSPQSNGAGDANLSENVYERLGYLMLFRQHVSRRAAGKGKSVLEEVELDTAIIDMLIENNPDDMESTVQAGLIKWSDQSKTPTWQVLCEAMKEASMDLSDINSLKQALTKPPSAPTGELARTPQAMQNVNDHANHVRLFRKHVSKNAASKGRAVLEGVGLKASSIQACFTAHPRKDEEAVQDGLMKWRGGYEGFQPPTWGVLIEAIEYAQIDQQAIKDLKNKLGLPS